MEFDLKKARRDKHLLHKGKSTHRPRPGQKGGPGDNERRSAPGGHATALPSQEKPVSYTATNPEQFQHLKRETDDIADLTEKKTYSRRVIVSNWERYELPPDAPDEINDGVLDFETLVNSLSDAKGHMKLGHERTWGNERSELQEPFFNIDMVKLSLSLETIPFHVRQNLPAELFTAEELSAFEQEVQHSLTQRKLFNIAVSEVTRPAEVKPPNDIVLTPLVTAVTAEEIHPECSQDAVLLAVSRSDKPPEDEKKKSPTSDYFETTENETTVTPPAAVSYPKNEELDLDFLLSLESAVPETPKVPPTVEALGVNASVQFKGATDTKKLDDWLDDLLDD